MGSDWLSDYILAIAFNRDGELLSLSGDTIQLPYAPGWLYLGQYGLSVWTFAFSQASPAHWIPNNNGIERDVYTYCDGCQWVYCFATDNFFTAGWSWTPWLDHPGVYPLQATMQDDNWLFHDPGWGEFWVSNDSWYYPLWAERIAHPDPLEWARHVLGEQQQHTGAPRPCVAQTTLTLVQLTLDPPDQVMNGGSITANVTPSEDRIAGSKEYHWAALDANIMLFLNQEQCLVHLAHPEITTGGYYQLGIAGCPGSEYTHVTQVWVSGVPPSGAQVSCSFVFQMLPRIGAGDYNHAPCNYYSPGYVSRPSDADRWRFGNQWAYWRDRLLPGTGADVSVVIP
jgi:hypothetical protein